MSRRASSSWSGFSAGAAASSTSSSAGAGPGARPSRYAASIEQADTVLNSVEHEETIESRLASPVWQQHELPILEVEVEEDATTHIIAASLTYMVLAAAVLFLLFFMSRRIFGRASARVKPHSAGMSPT